ncbi:hypothetical protein BD410DRAFT_785235 [Rickenella mellea]|uniref:F-box domain-containing protein n=1 Tax=Rickenella mellea TaxID=50990 RepID=A0A4Y7QDN1_9AGAM|nr:hypothetical protein BD410DRAFT_785235 [Rickenella mellea]
MVDDKKHSITTGVDGPSTSHVSVKRLSFEILSQIFLDCLPETGFPSVWTHEAPVILGRICSQWRSVSLRTPQLWAGLDLGSNRTDYTKDAMAAAEWKTRAGSCLLSYCLWHTPDILDVILPHCTQWRHFEAHLELDGWKQVYAAICQGAPRLQYLELHMINRPLSLWSATQIDIRVPIPGATGLQTLCACYH